MCGTLCTGALLFCTFSFYHLVLLTHRHAGGGKGFVAPEEVLELELELLNTVTTVLRTVLSVPKIPNFIQSPPL